MDSDPHGRGTGGAIGVQFARGQGPRVAAGGFAAARGAALCALMLAGLGLVAVVAVTAAFAALGYGLWAVLGGRRLALGAAVALPVVVAGLAVIHKGALSITAAVVLAALAVGLPACSSALLGVRWLAVSTRRLCGQWCGVPIADPYRPPPAALPPGYRGRLRWLAGDPSGLRDVLWFAMNACGGWVLAAAPAGMIAYGLIGLVLPGTGHVVAIPPPAFPGNTPEVLLALGVGCAGTGLWAGPWLLRCYGLLARSMLGPSGQAELALRVAHLAATRAETIDTGAAELRRIERDLHDGAQARLVAMGMALDAAGHLVDDDPAAARALLAEARESAGRALAELRQLVRGIHPPVLADRGLAEAVRALVLDLPLPVDYTSGLRGRPPAPVESAAYFAVSELLANVCKHSRARQAWVDLRHERGMLRIAVIDDGTGGADPARGSGLAGIERRLAAFDGVLAVSSPLGGPTVVNLEIPCVL